MPGKCKVTSLVPDTKKKKKKIHEIPSRRSVTVMVDLCDGKIMKVLKVTFKSDNSHAPALCCDDDQCDMMGFQGERLCLPHSPGGSGPCQWPMAWAWWGRVRVGSGWRSQPASSGHFWVLSVLPSNSVTLLHFCDTVRSRERALKSSFPCVSC